MNHHRAGRLLSAYLDGELTAAEVQAVQAHLLDCAVCREAHESLRTTRDLLAGVAPAEPPAEFWRTVRGPMMRGAAATALDPVWRGVRGAWRAAWQGAWRPIVLRRPAWALAAVVVMLALAALPLVKGTVDRLHATEIGVDLYVHDHAMQMGTAPLVDRAYIGLVSGDAELVLAGETPRPVGDNVR
ncbi:MAG TPA: zf-HC2 domain-containing protein [bacterium]|nr:zf-HC2 domain-containing protein [bacterium]